MALAAGDSIRLASPGSGGFGNPLKRDLAAVEKDLNAGLIGREVAERTYGAVIASVRPAGERVRYTLDQAAMAADIQRERAGIARWYPDSPRYGLELDPVQYRLDLALVRRQRA